ncbi:SAM4 [Candida jiufengensis]|uniref:SAM4 n=1 Tax=Candida jiufengensis TaxID=497108 RepID=UPI0022240DCA|nr:SAM4 [Candida jiufengensis]KAI5951582.1 SAM4 [Candida jiufengensis]
MTKIFDQKVIIDGALGTELEKLIDPTASYLPSKSPLWSGQVLIDAPQLIEKVHQNYIESGANLLITSTYQLSYGSLKKHTKLNDKEITELWQNSINVAEEAKSKAKKHSDLDKIFIAGSMGPYAAYLANGSEYTGDYGEVKDEELRNFHEPMIDFFYNNDKVDLILFETIPNFQELRVVNEIMQKYPNKDYVLSITCQTNDKLTDGTPLSKIKEYLDNNYKSKILGINCVDYILVDKIISHFPAYKFYIYPNLGFEYDSKIHQFKPKDHGSDITWEKFIKNLHKNNNVIGIGGCCNTGPEEINQIYEIYHS